MVVAFSVALVACGDEDDGKSNTDGGSGGGRPRRSYAGQDAGVEPGDRSEDAGDERDPDDLDGGGPDELDGALDGGEPGADAGRDARADAQPPGADAAGGMCAEPGEDCESTDCCAGATCILEPETGDPICAAECSGPSECNSGCCLSVRDSEVGACGPARYCEAPPVPMGSGCDALLLIAEDGTYLGDAASNRSAADGVCNELSSYGSSFGADSIFNELGTYGSELSAQSAYNRFTTTPPALICIDSDEIVAFVTKNQFVVGAPLVDPDALCAVLANSGF